MFLFLVLLAIVSTQAMAQEEVVYGTVRTDGYQKITKGAFWSKRPEAKIIYEGGNAPSGYAVYVLEKDYYVRFIDSEHNNLDRNYIVFPKGEKVYADNVSGSFYSAKCGNEIEFIRPVDMVRIVEVEKEVIVRDTIPMPVSSSVYLNIRTNNYYELPQPNVEQKLKKGRFIPVVVIGGIMVGVGLGYLIYSLISNHHGGPGGAPVTIPTTPIVPVVPGGGPGGAPTTK